MLKHCGNCANYIWGDGKTPLPEVCVTCKNDLTGEDKGPSNWRPQSMTNADCIRSMSDEELAVFLDRAQEEEAKFLHAINPDGTWQYTSVRSGWLKWLQQPINAATDTNVGSK